MALSYTSLISQFTTLSQNNTSSNQSLAGILINQTHKYLLLRYFDNERHFTMTTVGTQNLTLTTATLAAGSTGATLTSAWPYISCQQLIVLHDGEQRTAFFTQGSSSVSWQSATTTAQAGASGATIACAGVQSYRMPANISKLKTSSITIGQLVYMPYPVNSVNEWVKLNALPYNASYPAYFFLYNDELQFWPIPSSTGNIIDLYAQIKVADMTYQDYSTGAIAAGGMTIGSNMVYGNGLTSWSVFPLNVDLTFTNLQLVANPPYGDGLNYQIQNFTSATGVTLIKPVVYAPNEAGAGTYTIGQYPLLDDNFHDAIVYGALRTYFSSISKDTDKAGYFGGLYKEKLDAMEGYLSTKSINVDLSGQVLSRNPNLFWQGRA